MKTNITAELVIDSPIENLTFDDLAALISSGDFSLEMTAPVGKDLEPVLILTDERPTQ